MASKFKISLFLFLRFEPILPFGSGVQTIFALAFDARSKLVLVFIKKNNETFVECYVVRGSKKIH